TPSQTATVLMPVMGEHAKGRVWSAATGSPGLGRIAGSGFGRRALDLPGWMSVSSQLEGEQWSELCLVTRNYAGARADLVGRSDELATVGAFLDQARTRGAALLIFGDPGAGKTVLLDAAAEMALAAGTRVLRASGVEFEADMPFAKLHQVLLPLHEE